MLKIRKNIFETNSSSGDYYNDYDDNDTGSNSTSHQLIHIIFKLQEELSEEEITKFEKDTYDKLMSFEDKLYEILYELSPDGTDDGFEFWEDGCDGEYYYLDILSEVKGTIHVISPEIPRTWDYPGDYGVWEWLYEGFPLKNETVPALAKAKEDILKLFKENGITQFVEITELYADEADKDEFEDNVY
ncbi:MAG: hypothetical protein VZS44_12175 [Bacilli bacterium]|nr:hypothetical protein [Bacilli bacterium]